MLNNNAMVIIQETTPTPRSINYQNDMQPSADHNSQKVYTQESLPSLRETRGNQLQSQLNNLLKGQSKKQSDNAASKYVQP